jgi:hypothetical protein
MLLSVRERVGYGQIGHTENVRYGQPWADAHHGTCTNPREARGKAMLLNTTHAHHESETFIHKIHVCDSMTLPTAWQWTRKARQESVLEKTI